MAKVQKPATKPALPKGIDKKMFNNQRWLNTIHEPGEALQCMLRDQDVYKKQIPLLRKYIASLETEEDNTEDND